MFNSSWSAVCFAQNRKAILYWHTVNIYTRLSSRQITTSSLIWQTNIRLLPTDIVVHVLIFILAVCFLNVFFVFYTWDRIFFTQASQTTTTTTVSRFLMLTTVCIILKNIKIKWISKIFIIDWVRVIFLGFLFQKNSWKKS